MPPPFNPFTGKFASLVKEGDFPCCAMFQVAAEDTHDNYVICRGYDPRFKRFFEYEEGSDVKIGMPVAKPYGSRQAGVYTVGQMFPAVLPLTRLGISSGVAAESSGHPADLDEVVEILYTDEGKVINWLLLDVGTSSVWGKLDAALDYDDTTGVTVSIWKRDGSFADTGDNISNVLPPEGMTVGTFASGSVVKVEWIDGLPYVTYCSACAT
jgi:hypothetical protein